MTTSGYGYGMPAGMPPPRPQRRSVPSMVIGWILIVIGLLTAVAGVALLVLFGSGRPLTSEVNTFSSASPALVADLGTIDNATEWTRFSGAPTLVITAPGSSGAASFIGVGRTADVDRYLSGVARDQITDFNVAPFVLNVQRVDGTDAATAPAEQTFWVAQLETGQANQFSWTIEDGTYSVVVMNADGSAGVNAPVSIGVSIPNATGWWVSIIVIGGLMLIGGVALVVFGSRSVPMPQYAPYYPPQAPYPYPPQSAQQYPDQPQPPQQYPDQPQSPSQAPQQYPPQ